MEPITKGGTGFICVRSEGGATTTDKLVEIAVENMGPGVQQQVRAVRRLTQCLPILHDRTGESAISTRFNELLLPFRPNRLVHSGIRSPLLPSIWESDFATLLLGQSPMAGEFAEDDPAWK